MTVASGGSAAAGMLEDLARRCRRGHQLRGLAQALRAYHAAPTSLDSARGWASVDLFAAFLSEDPGLPEARRAGRFWTTLDGIIQVAVFVPILLTWIGLAGAAFTARSGESMLQSWETAGLPGFALHLVAVYTAGIVFLLVVGSAALVIHRRSVEAKDAQLRQDLADALTRADLELSPLRLGITERVAQEMDRAADKLAETVGKIETAGREASRAQQAAGDAVSAALPVLSSVESVAKASRDAAAELGAAPDKIARGLANLAAAASQVGQAERDLITATEGAAKQVADTVATAATDIAAATAASSVHLAGTLDGHASEMRLALNEVTVVAAGYASRTEVAADVLGQTQKALVSTHKTLAELPAAVDNLNGGVSSIGGQFTELATAIAAAKEAAALLLEVVTALGDQAAGSPAPIDRQAIAAAEKPASRRSSSDPGKSQWWR